jgi:hypothetical protein
MAKSSRPSQGYGRPIEQLAKRMQEATTVCLIVVKEARTPVNRFFFRADWIDAEEPDRLSGNKVIQSKFAKRSTNV